MKRKRFATEQIIKILKEAELGIKITELCWKHGIFDQTFCNWRNKYGGMGISKAKRLKLIKDENRYTGVNPGTLYTIVKPIGFSAFPWPKAYCVLGELTSPYVHNLYQSQSTPKSPRTHCAAASALALDVVAHAMTLEPGDGLWISPVHSSRDSMH